jgi:hypothetical protein
MSNKWPPKHIEAKTPDELRRLMFKINAKYQRNFHFFDFTFANGKWHCWFELSSKEEVGIRANNEEEK